jgi:hypothetical protein
MDEASTVRQMRSARKIQSTSNVTLINSTEKAHPNLPMADKRSSLRLAYELGDEERKSPLDLVSSGGEAKVNPPGCPRLSALASESIELPSLFIYHQQILAGFDYIVEERYLCIEYRSVLHD